MEIKNTLCFYSRRSWWFYRFLRAQYAVCFLQYALSNKLGVIECLGFESLASTLNHQLSTINSQLKSLILVLGSWFLIFVSRWSWRFYRFLRAQYAVCFLQYAVRFMQYAVCFLWGVIEWLGFWVLRFTCSQVHKFTCSQNFSRRSYWFC